MKKVIAKILIIIFVEVVCAVTASYYTQRSMNQAYANSIANLNLYDLNYVVDAL